MERPKRIASNFFARLGYSVTSIPEADEKRADLDVHDGNDQYIVEVKEKIDTGSQIRLSKNPIDDSEHLVGCEPFARSNGLDNVFKKTKKQLADTPSDDAAYQLIWLHTEGINADMMARRALFTFYGVTTLSPGALRGNAVNCVYFDYSTAFAAPSVDGLIVVENDKLLLCLNEFSPRYLRFRDTKLVRVFGDAVYDPATFESREGTIVLRSNVSRKEKNEVLRELERISGIPYTIIEMNRYTFGHEA